MPDHVSTIVRRADIFDADEVAAVWLASRRAAVPQIPLPVHPDTEVVAWFAGTVLPSEQEVWVVDESRGISAMLVLDGTWVEQLYVRPECSRQGLGSALIEFAKTRQAHLQLWTFQSNLDARRFYERHGFVPREMTEGDNEERAPDVRYEWQADAALGPDT